VPGRRYNCDCGKKRYRDEASALAAASADETAYRETVTVYRCPGGLAWHLSAHGFVPEALRSVGRRLAFELAERGGLDLDDFGDPRRRVRAARCADQMVDLGLAAREAGHLRALDVPGLRRVVQVGLDAYYEEHI
jgi:hypothetical protein